MFPYVRPHKAVVQLMPQDWVLGKSNGGWMKSDIFFKYNVDNFERWLKKLNIKRPVIIFIDEHKLQITMALSKACEQKNIILWASCTKLG